MDLDASRDREPAGIKLLEIKSPKYFGGKVKRALIKHI